MNEQKNNSKKKINIWPILRGWLTDNIGMKLLSVVLAIALWTLVVYSDDTITRSRTVEDLTPILTGQTTLSANYLALVTNPLEELDGVSVELEVPQAQYSRVNSNNVRVRLDLANVRSTGTQLVPFTVTSTYGTVKNVYPSSVEVDIEALDSRSVPMNAAITGKADNYWYNVKSLNPSTITVSGASSIVQNITKARVTVDVSDMTESDTRAYPFQLMDYKGLEVPQELVTRTSSSVSATVEIYPTKELQVNSDLEDVFSGSIAEGYEVESVEVSPDTIVVAAEQELLDELTSLAVVPIEADQVNRSFTVRTSIPTLQGVRHYSTEQVYVTVNIREREATVAFSDLPVTLLNIPGDLVLADDPDAVSVQVSGPYSLISDLTRDMLQITADLSGAEEGSGEYPVQVSVPGRPQLTFQLSLPELPLKFEPRNAPESNQ